MQKVNHFSLRKTAMYGLTSCLIGIAFMGAGRTVKADAISGAITDIKTEEVQQKQADEPADKVSQSINADQQKSSDTQKPDDNIQNTANKISASTKVKSIQNTFNTDNKKPTIENKQTSLTDNKNQSVAQKTNKQTINKEKSDKIIATIARTNKNKVSALTNTDTKTITRTITLQKPVVDKNHNFLRDDPQTITQTATFSRNIIKNADGTISYGAWDKNSAILPAYMPPNVDRYIPHQLSIPEVTVTPDSKNINITVKYDYDENINTSSSWVQREIILNIPGKEQKQVLQKIFYFCHHYFYGKPGVPGRTIEGKTVYVPNYEADINATNNVFNEYDAPFISYATPDIRIVPAQTIDLNKVPDEKPIIINYKLNKQEHAKAIREITIHKPDGESSTTPQELDFTRIWQHSDWNEPLKPGAWQCGWPIYDDFNNIPDIPGYKASQTDVPSELFMDDSQLNPKKPYIEHINITYSFITKKLTDETDKITRTVNFKNEDGTPIRSSIIQSVTFTRTKTLTGPDKITYGNWTTDNDTFDSVWLKIPGFRYHIQEKISDVSENYIWGQKVKPGDKSTTVNVIYSFIPVVIATKSKSVIRTIHFVDTKGNTMHSDAVQTVTFMYTKTQTGPNSFTSAWKPASASFAEYKVPTITGYTPSRTIVKQLTVTPDMGNTSVIITYTKNSSGQNLGGGQTTKPAQPTTPVGPTTPSQPTQVSQATQPAPVHPTVPPTQPTKPSQQIPPKAAKSPQIAKPGQSAKSGNVKPKATRGGKEGISVKPQSETGKNDRHKLFVLPQHEQRKSARSQKAEPISAQPNKQAKMLPQTSQRNNKVVAFGLAILNLGLLILAGLGLRKRKN